MRAKFYAFPLLLSLFSPLALAIETSCKAMGVHDGYTFTCLDSGWQQIKVPIAEIEPPESKQPYDAKAKQILSNLMFGEQVALKMQDTDRDGRTVAWVYRQYSND